MDWEELTASDYSDDQLKLLRITTKHGRTVYETGVVDTDGEIWHHSDATGFPSRYLGNVSQHKIIHFINVHDDPFVEPCTTTRRVITQDNFNRDMIQIQTGNDHFVPTKGKRSPQKRSVTIDGYVARDRYENLLFLHEDEPYRAHSGYQIDGKEDEWRSEGAVPYPLPTEAFADLSWSDDPRKVRITIEEI